MRTGGEIVYVAVGANLGNREATFTAAIRAVEAESDLLLLSASPVFETEPMGPAGQGAYLNAVMELRVWLGPVELLRRLQSIEIALGRDRSRETQRWGGAGDRSRHPLFWRSMHRITGARRAARPRARTNFRDGADGRDRRVLRSSNPRDHRGARSSEHFPIWRGVRAWPRPPGWPGTRHEST